MIPEIYYGSYHCPVVFNKIVDNGNGSETLVSDKKFFHTIRCGTENCHMFYAVICPCLEWNDSKIVYVSDDNNVTKMELDTRSSGFRVRGYELTPYAGKRRVIQCLACYDEASVGNNYHVNVLSPIIPLHEKCCDCCAVPIIPAPVPAPPVVV